MAVEISDWNDIAAIDNDLSADYVLTNDLDENTNGYFTIGSDFTPIGFIQGDYETRQFSGSFDGNGFEVRDLVINTSDESIGFFATTDTGALIENLTVSGTVDNSGTGRHVAGFIGSHYAGTIQNCTAKMDVTAPDNSDVAGFVGFISNGATILNSSVIGSVDGGNDAGNFVATNRGSISNSFSSGSVNGKASVGGFVGTNQADGEISDSYSLASVTADSVVGGFVGHAKSDDSAKGISSCYSVGSVNGSSNVTTGSFCGRLGASSPFGANSGFIVDSFVDEQSSGVNQTIGENVAGTGDITPLTTSEMQGSEVETNMSDFDFANVWVPVLASDGDASEDGYPILSSVNRETQLTAQGIIVLFDLSVSTSTPTNITQFSATLNGELLKLDAEANDADVFFEFGKNLGDNSTAIQTLQAPATFNDLVDGLDPSTTLEFRAVAKAKNANNETFTSRGETLSFTTDAITFDIEALVNSQPGVVKEVFVQINGEVKRVGEVFAQVNGVVEKS